MVTLTSRTVISNRGEYPVSVAVLGEFIYYIARDRRYMLQYQAHQILIDPRLNFMNYLIIAIYSKDQSRRFQK